MSDPSRPNYMPGGITGKGFVPGRSGNPGGRPKGRTLTGILRDLLEREHNGRQVIDVLAERIVKEALSGKFPFAKELWDRVEGRLSERHDVSVRPMTAEEKVATLTEDDLVYLARKNNLVDQLPPALREKAERQDPERRRD